MTRDAGTYCIVGHYTNTGEIGINPHLEINSKHLNIVASWGSDFSHFYLGVKCKQDNFNSYTQNLVMDKFKNKFPWEKIITREYSLEEAGQALEDVKSLKVMKAIIKPTM